jgi:hypothetical protein
LSVVTRGEKTSPASQSGKGRVADAELLLAAALIGGALVIGLATVGDYSITIDEFNVNAYGPKSLAWYTSGFTDRSSFETVEDTLWYYGPWFHILIAWVQSLGLGDSWTIRHAMTFSIGLAGIALLLPIGRLALGRWAGLAAIMLCLTCGYLYGSLFFTPIDVPFLFAMTLATLAIIAMAARAVPAWPATIGAGLATGLAIATRSSGIITQVYLLAAMGLCGLEVLAGQGASMRRDLLRIGARLGSALAIGWMTAVALWPWLQIGNPMSQFVAAFLLFANHPNSFDMPFWGMRVLTTDLPWFYVPGQFLARLPEGFLLLLATGIASGFFAAYGLARATAPALRQRQAMRLQNAALSLARSRGYLLVWAAVVLPVGFIIVRHSTLYDGIRHVMFVIPMLALIAGAGLLRLLPVVGRFPATAAAVGGGYLGFAIWMLVVLHPLEYVATNVVVGGVAGAYGRFDLDYWAVAARVALSRLESRLDYQHPELFSKSPPSITVCMSYREWGVEPLFGRPWRLETDPHKADFIIATERWPCAGGIDDAVLIDEVQRFGRPFAWVYLRTPLAWRGSAVSSWLH